MAGQEADFENDPNICGFRWWIEERHYCNLEKGHEGIHQCGYCNATREG